MRRRLDRSGIFIGFIATLMAGSSLLPGTLTGAPYPGATWTSVKPEDHNWSGAKLNDAWLYAQAIGSGAVLIVDDGVVVGQWGEVDRKWPCYAIRRGFLPKRGSHPPGTFWLHNNWDVNALGTIYEQATKWSVFSGFDRLIALPLQMEDFDAAHDTRYFRDPSSLHPADMFRMSSRDLARFGLLYLRHGGWAGNKQIVPAKWIDQSIHPYSQVGSVGGFGYLWSTALNGDFVPFVDLGDDAFGLEGSHGHFLIVAPALNLVIVHRCADDSGSRDVTRAEFGHLLELILSARTNVKTTGEVPGARDANPRFAAIVQKAVGNALDVNVDTAAYAPKLAAKLKETPAWKRILEFRGTTQGQPVDLLRIYRIESYANESYYYLEVLVGIRPLALRCGLNKAGQIIYLNTIE